ncbi:hepatocyte nuclear factor 6 [Panthera pardus]|uniref:One cut domain family member n=14 Tax=Carnivora TaxID=33554 RepID=M3Y823_MUSPF|nr:hepatocyte nuclear factor 6 [Felis catus]XP_004396634.1 PREDICTED: hepatocyte nuclear factor 6 [Odobenus rosmarus divergens]XP_004755448.1 hepatocyte nuclear factor 6 isoform X1 [Mustela putorius furo]XP_019297618.1 hepatocyte nuclear factor 6 [Panthera pardus]XP_019660025.2 hepatocyte nuclear factor 6 [Ailuropoda melanoleuca]XP_022348584.1 hepatocyte nuclear factor 6 [Enhydra lutris kenyoni]XP_025739815.1 hepatocyte nuclear factor 6 [Callorhinus ursinus]XP_025775541.1 hepatocyte nuclear 
MNAQLTMEAIGELHGVSHEPVPAPADLLGGSPHARSSVAHRGSHLPPAHPRSMGMASLLDGGGGGGDYHHHHRAPEHSLAGPLHPTMTMACETPPGMSMPTTYTTLTPLQPLPPISTVSDKFPHHHHHHHHHHHPHHHQRLAGNVSGSFTLMRDERGLASMNNLYTPYHKDVAGMGQSLSPLSSSGLGGIHNSQQGLPHYAHPGAAMPTDKMLTPNGFEAHHPAMLGRHGEQHLTPTSAGMVPINGLPPHHPHAHLNAQGHGQLLGTAREPNPSVTGAQVSNGSNSGQMEEINTKEVAQRITTELKRYSIPQAIFAQRVLCRSQGTLSDLLRNPKPWSKLKSGRETFRRMWKWLQEPEFQRMSALRLAACKRKEQEHGKDRGNTPKKPRLVFTDVQRRTLHAIFKENKRPSKELQITISQQLGLELSTVSNFFMNARRRSLDKWQDEGSSNSGNSSSSSSTCTKA